MTATAPPVSPAPHQTRHRHRARGTWLMCWPVPYGAALGLLLFWLARDALPDDALISLSYARNVAEHGCWCLTTGVPANTATSPLNVWLLAGLTWLTGGAFVAAGVLLAGCFALIAWWLHRLAGPAAALLGVGLLATAPVLTSAVGLETYLAATVLLGVAYCATRRRVVACGVACGLAVLTRPDLAAAVVVAVLVLVAARRWWVGLAALPIGALIALPWHLFTWWNFGSAVPATLPVKAEQPGWGDGSIHLAESLPMYLAEWPTSTALTLAALGFGVLAAVVAMVYRWWVPVALMAAGAADLAAMAATAQAPAAYYPGPAVGAAVLAAALVAGRVRWASPLPVLLLVAGAVFTLAWPGWSAGMAPLRQNWATVAEYAAIASALPTDGVILSTGEIGALAFYGQDRGCTVVDPWLADPGRTDRYVARWRAEHPWAELNWRHYHPPTLLPVAYRLDFSYSVPPQPGDWPITGAGGVPGVARLSPAS